MLQSVDMDRTICLFFIFKHGNTLFVAFLEIDGLISLQNYLTSIM